MKNYYFFIEDDENYYLFKRKGGVYSYMSDKFNFKLDLRFVMFDLDQPRCRIL